MQKGCKSRMKFGFLKQISRITHKWIAPNARQNEKGAMSAFVAWLIIINPPTNC